MTNWLDNIFSCQKGVNSMSLIRKNLRIILRFGIFAGLLVSSMVLMQSCFPYGPEDIEEFDIVATFRADDVNFGAITTFALPDSIVRIDNSGGNNNSGTTGQYDALILDQVATNLVARGYTRVQDPDEADVIVTVAITLEGFNLYGEYNYSDYWGWYTPDYDDGYEYDYGGYGSQQNYDLQLGTVLINMSNPSLASTGTMPTIWIGIINGIAEQSLVNTSTRLIQLINQCFAQSPYLGRSGS
ncbi:MAG: DUF4136 domain-containing protein [Calditrichales bacterium]|nr:MAG: DUF4136 domain-containing protein [Calditrichales bacterium]